MNQNKKLNLLKSKSFFTNSQIKGIGAYYKSNLNKKIGRVKEVLVDKEAGKILGLIIEGDGVLQSAKFLPLEHIFRLSLTSVVIDKSTSLKKVGVKRQKFYSDPWFGMPIYSEKKEDFGTMADFVWSFPSGRLEAVAISGGIWQDLNNGWQYLPWQEISGRDIKNNQLFINSQANLTECCNLPNLDL